MASRKRAWLCVRVQGTQRSKGNGFAVLLMNKQSSHGPLAHTSAATNGGRLTCNFLDSAENVETFRVHGANTVIHIPVRHVHRKKPDCLYLCLSLFFFIHYPGAWNTERRKKKKQPSALCEKRKKLHISLSAAASRHLDRWMTGVRLFTDPLKRIFLLIQWRANVCVHLYCHCTLATHARTHLSDVRPTGAPWQPCQWR